MGETSTFLNQNPGSGNTEFLVNRAKNGSPRAWEELYRRYRVMLITHLRAMITGYPRRRFDEEDVLQIAFTKAFKHIQDFKNRGEGSFRAWLARIVHNTFLDEMERQRRERGRESSTDLGQLVDDSPKPNGPDGGNLSGMLEAMGNLSIEERDLIIQRHFDNRGWEEIARSLGCSTKKARKLCDAAFEKLQRHLKRE